MKKQAALAIRVFFLFVTLALFSRTASAGDMELDVQDDITVLLHEDHTWDYKSLSSPKLKDDMTILLESGTPVKVKKNKTWYFVEQESKTATESSSGQVEYLESAYATGNATGENLFNAKTNALSAAVKHLAKKLFFAANDKTLSMERLTSCIEEEDKMVKIQEKQNNKLWSVVVNMSLDRDQIQFILDCARSKLE